MAKTKTPPALVGTVQFTEKQLRGIATTVAADFMDCFNEESILAAGILKAELVDAIYSSDKFREAILSEIEGITDTYNCIDFVEAVSEQLDAEFTHLMNNILFIEGIILEAEDADDQSDELSADLSHMIDTLMSYGYTVTK